MGDGGAVAWLRQEVFLTGLLQRPCWTLIHPERLDWEDQEVVATLYAALDRESSFASARVPTTEVRTVSRLEALGFRVVDTNVQLSDKAPPPLVGGGWGEGERGPHCRFARPDDREAVTEVARESFSLTRFHLDPRIDRGQADAIKAAWAANYFTGQRGQAMVIGEIAGVVQGFLQLLQVERVLIIDLIAVRPAGRSQGLGRQMIAFARTHLDGFDVVQVGTQVANVGSLNFYQRLGFRIMETRYILHRHSGPAV